MGKNKTFALLTVMVIFAVSLVGCGGGDSFEKQDMKKVMKLANYKGLEYKLGNVETSEEEVNQYIDAALAKDTKTEKITSPDTVVNDGDAVNIKFVGKMDGKEFNGGSSDSFDMVLGQTPMIEGFSEGIAGHKVGENFTLNLKFPDDYHAKELAGKPVDFEITINYLEKKTVPELTDEWVSKNTKYKSVDEYKASVKEELNINANKAAKDEAKYQLLNDVIKNTKFEKLPKELVDEEVKRSKEIMEKIVLSKQKLSFEEYAKSMMANNKDIKDPVKELERQIKEDAKNAVKRKLVVAAIAKNEKLEVTDKEKENQFKDILKSMNMNIDKFEKEYKMNKKEAIELFDYKYYVLSDKVASKLMELGKNTNPQ